ncbi:bifunctional diguanylate cyclase/phosphodiesterase [Campylobacter pinnipediorum]|uniref:bifunctional diguanylate cyclase/phosphodiesterase n=1 Tax=Campylobacter pinnipediorum TaxID=1965231 RepID=UPI0009950B78|nr:bifunctional diguanylate cyclase/phosphodiesterase [Campylobacter pinnipediorum]AQW83283.1 diguanylate phosphodiesterase [Campylobacter pinnipediorum subsp. pinnipediorum]
MNFRFKELGKLYITMFILLSIFISFVCYLFNFTFLSYMIELIAMAVISKKIYASISKLGEQRELWILLSLSSILWIVCDLNWYIYKFILLKDYNEYSFLHIAYLIPTFFILIGTGSYFYKKFKHEAEDKMLILNDALGIFLMLSVFLISFFKDYNFILITKNITQFSAFFSIIFSFMILFFVLNALFASNTISINLSIFYVIISCVILSLINITYFKDMVNSNHLDSRFLNIFYIIPFMIIMFGAYEFQGANRVIKQKNINFSIIAKWIPIISIIPVIFQKNIEAEISIFILLIIFGHILLSYYVKNTIYSNKLLKKEQNLTNELEKKVAMHTNELIIANLKLKELIEKDYLTGLHTNDFIIHKISELLEKQTKNECIAVYYINIKRFKLTNSCYGYIVGDKILKIVGKRLLILCDENKIVGRLNADEFAIVAKFEDKSKKNLLNFANQIIGSIKENIQIESYNFALDCIVGIGISDYNSKKDAKSIIINADQAMNFAKEAPSLNPLIYTEEMSRLLRHDSKIDILLNNSQINKEFEIYLQPVLDTKTNKIVSAEALLRWNNPELGFLEANSFIEIAKKTDIANKFFEFVIQKISLTIKDFKLLNIKPPIISINIFSNKIYLLEFIEKIQENLKNYKVNPKYIMLELDESIWMNSKDILENIFIRLQRIGINVCIDNFGAGCSSLLYTRTYKISHIKIANKLISNIHISKDEQEIVQSIIEFGKIIGAKTIAKGLENKETLELVKKLNCDEVQGYIVAKPMSIDNFINFLRKNNES